MSQSNAVAQSSAAPALPKTRRRLNPFVFAVLAAIGLWIGLASACSGAA